MTTTQKYYLGAAAVTVAVFAGTLVAYPQLPAVVPLHWDAHGNVNGWGPKWSLFLTGPGADRVHGSAVLCASLALAEEI